VFSFLNLKFLDIFDSFFGLFDFGHEPIYLVLSFQAEINVSTKVCTLFILALVVVGSPSDLVSEVEYLH
jgi:hypothetical protein